MGGLAAAALLLLFAAPTPYVLYEPGIVVRADELVTVVTAESRDRHASPEQPDRAAGAASRESDAASREPDPAERTPDGRGGWLLATVYLRERASPWSVIASAWRSDREAYARRAVFQGDSKEAYRRRMDVLMAESQAKALEAAFRAAGVRYETVPDGVYVVRGSGRLRAGDRIAAVDGAAVNGLDELAEALRARAGRAAELTVLRDGRRIGMSLTAEEIAAEAGGPDETAANGTAAYGTAAGAPRYRLAGAELTEIPDVRPVNPGLRVTIEDGDLAGPSAGLPLALHIYERLTGEPLAGGRRIAATGTIEPGGAVGAVGGTAMKAIAAARAGADLFLVPEANREEAAAAAEAAGGGMAVAGVNTLEEALNLLRADRVLPR